MDYFNLVMIGGLACFIIFVIYKAVKSREDM